MATEPRTQAGATPAPNGDGLIFAFAFDGGGGGRAVGWDEIRTWCAGSGILWLHLDRRGEAAERWLESDSGIDPVMVETLLQGDSRPRAVTVGDELMVYLRGVNLNPGADPEDMVGIALWIGSQRVVSIRHRRVMAANDLREALGRRRGPTDAGSFLVEISEQLLERIVPIVADLEDQVDQLEDQVLTAAADELRGRLANLRREAIALRRYLAPQREVMARLPLEQVGWLDPRHKRQLREIADRMARIVEDLDAARERAAVTQDELNSRISDQMNRTMYILTVTAAILLPPSFVTGLFGVNLGGMPGLQTPYAFAALIFAIIAIGIFEYWLLRRLKWV